MAKHIYAVPFSYEMYGRIEIEAESEEEARKKAADALVYISTDDMNSMSSYLEDSLEIDDEGVVIDRGEVTRANTKITYLYRDASNYKRLNEVVVSGRCLKEDIDRITGKLEAEGSYFIPEQLGLPLYRPDDKITADDHCWAELISIEETDEPETLPIAWTNVLFDFEKAFENGWDDVKYAV